MLFLLKKMGELVFAKFCFLALIVVSFVETKRFNMQVLLIQVMNGLAPGFGQSCTASAKFVFEAVNNRSDLLSDYDLSVRTEDENLGSAAARIVANYYRDLSPGINGTSITLKSPILMGPSYTSGCKAVGSMMHLWGGVTLSSTCMTPALKNKRIYPNLYLEMSPTDPFARAIVHFVKDVAGWRRMAVIGNANNVNDYVAANTIQTFAQLVNISIPYFNLVTDIDQNVLQSLKLDDIRVIVIMTSTGNTILWKFYCQAYQAGITGPRYVFLTNMAMYSDPIALPLNVAPNCSRDIATAQFAYTLFFGSSLIKSNAVERSSLGHTIAEMNAAVDRKLNGVIPPDNERRALCYDIAMTAAVALDRTDKYLRRYHNRSLADYFKIPILTGNILNDTLANIELVGLRLSRLKFSEIDSLQDNDISVVSYWTRHSGLRPIFELVPVNNNTDEDDSKYEPFRLQRISSNNFSWMAWKNGEIPPKDASNLLVHDDLVSSEIFTSVIVIGVLVSCFPLAAITAMFVWSEQLPGNQLSLSKLAGCIGCLILNAGAISFASASDQTEALVTFRIVFLVVGLFCVNSVQLLRTIVMYSKWRGYFLMKPERTSTTGWFLKDPILCGSKRVGQNQYDDTSDTIRETWITICQSRNMGAWIAPLLAATCSALIVGLISAYSLKRILSNVKRSPRYEPFRLESTLNVAGLVNSLTMLVSVVLIYFILNGKSVKQNSLIAFASLLYSFLTVIILSVPLFPLLRERICPTAGRA